MQHQGFLYPGGRYVEYSFVFPENPEMIIREIKKYLKGTSFPYGIEEVVSGYFVKRRKAGDKLYRVSEYIHWHSVSVSFEFKEENKDLARKFLNEFEDFLELEQT